MGKNSTKNKTPMVTILVVVLALIVISNWDDIRMYGENPIEAFLLWAGDAVDGVLEPGSQLQIPSDPQDGSGMDGSASTDLPNPERDTILAAVPEHLRSNYFLTYKENGCCKSLTGAVHVTVVMISDSVSTWDDASVSKLQSALNDSALDIVSEAKSYGTQVSVSFGYHHASLTGDICSGDYSNDWQDPALVSAGLPALSQMHDHITGTYQAKEAPVIFAFNKESRAYASVGDDEFLVLFSNDDFGGFQHELSHVFGAKDFYYPTEVKDLAGTYFPDSIMNSGETADPLTAYLIGWADTLADSAISFLERTNTITAEYMDQQGDIESFTGNGTKIFDYGTYTGDLVRGVCHGTGTMNYNDGGWYTGGWTNGSWSGKGTGKSIFTNGDVYEGEFQDGLRHGTGTYTYADGAVYTGSWSNGEQHGTGTMNYANGGWYTGGWNNDSRSGTGTGKEVYDNGVYEGAFLDGNRHGQGTYIWTNGDSYTGQWANGERTGYGTYTWADGSSQSGTWQDGKFIG